MKEQRTQSFLTAEEEQELLKLHRAMKDKRRFQVYRILSKINIDKFEKYYYMIQMTTNLNISEIFYSIQGETTKAGFPSLFIRLSGCNLNCKYCDTGYAKLNGEEYSIEKIIQTASSYRNIHHVTLTGGEPLLQTNSIVLMRELKNIGYAIQLETNGSIDLSNVPAYVHKIVDVKTPSSGEGSSFLMENLKFVNGSDEFKFVLSDIDDYKFSAGFIKTYLKDCTPAINFSPVYGKLSGAELAELILIDRLPVRLNLQLHKILWPEGEAKDI